MPASGLKPIGFFALLLVGLVLLAPGLVYAQTQADNPKTPSENVADVNSAIEVGGAKLDDRVIQKRITELFGNIDALVDLHSEVTAGVVRLSGSAPSKQAYEQALRLVQRVEGVVAVNDQIDVDRSIRSRMLQVSQSLFDRLLEIIAFLPLLLVGIAFFLLFWMLSGLLLRWNSLFRKVTPNPFLQNLLRQIVRGVFLLTGFIILLEILDATALLGTIIGAAGILGLAIGFAIRDTVENYLASILLSLRQPFDANDHVEIEGHEGLVLRLTSRETVLMTLDGNHVRIPNATVYKSILTNFSRNPKRRFSFEVGVDTAVNLNAARSLGVSSLAATAGVAQDPPPGSRIKLLGDSNVVLVMLGWVDQNEHDFSKVRSEAIRAVKRAFDDANFEMPEPIYRVKLEGLGSVIGKDNSTAPAAVASQPTPQTSQAQTDAPADVGREHFIEQQIEAEKRMVGEQDLLNDEHTPRSAN